MSGKSLAKAYEKEAKSWLDLKELVRVLPPQLERPLGATSEEHRSTVLELTNQLRLIEFSGAEFKRYSLFVTDVVKALSVKWNGREFVFGKSLKSKLLERPDVAALFNDSSGEMYKNAQRINARAVDISSQISPEFARSHISSPLKEAAQKRSAFAKLLRLVENDRVVETAQRKIGLILDDSQWEATYGWSLPLEDQIHETRRACNRWLAADLAINTDQVPEADHAIEM